MHDYPTTAKGGCHCGAVQYEVTSKPDFVAVCHCQSCRQTTGAPAVVYSVYSEENVKFTRGERRFYNSSTGVSRTFCQDCGTPLSYEAEWRGDIVIGFFVGTLAEPDRFPPQRHVFHGDRVSWYDVADTLPRYKSTPTASKEPDGIGPSV